MPLVDDLFADPSSTGWTVYESTCGGCESKITHDLAVITSGSDVRLAKLDDVVRATAPVSSHDEAAAILQLKGYGLDCDMKQRAPGSRRLDVQAHQQLLQR